MALHSATMDCIKYTYPETWKSYNKSTLKKTGSKEMSSLVKINNRPAGVSAKDLPVSYDAPAELKRCDSVPASVLSVASSTPAAKIVPAKRDIPPGWRVPRTPTESQLYRTTVPGQFGPRPKPKGLEHDIYGLYESDYTHGSFVDPGFKLSEDPAHTLYAPKDRSKKKKGRDIRPEVPTESGLNYAHGNWKMKPPVLRENMRISEIPELAQLNSEWEELFTAPPRENPSAISQYGYKRNPQGNRYHFSSAGVLA